MQSDAAAWIQEFGKPAIELASANPNCGLPKLLECARLAGAPIPEAYTRDVFAAKTFLMAARQEAGIDEEESDPVVEERQEPR